jgi:citrate synthase
MSGRDRPTTGLGKAEDERVLVRGHDLTDELLGSTSFADMTGLILLGRRLSADESRMVDALLVVLVEHGLVKPVVAARFVYSNAPESLQAAVAASLLGAGSRHLGSSEWAARYLQEALATAGQGAPLEPIAGAIVEDHLARGERIAGIGHRTHPAGDPRAVRLLALARETGTYGRHCELLELVATEAGRRHGRPLPPNVTGAIAAIASDLGFRWQISRAFALIGRTLGALGHIQEEMDAPIADALVRRIQAEVDYDPG